MKKLLLLLVVTCTLLVGAIDAMQGGNQPESNIWPKQLETCWKVLGRKDAVNYDLTARSQQGLDSLLRVAAGRGYGALVNKLLQAGANAASTREEDFHTALHLAAVLKDQKAAVAITKALLATKQGDELPLFINATTNKGWTALHKAAFYGNGDVVKIILDYGANISLRTTDEQKTALDLAFLYGKNATLHLSIAETEMAARQLTLTKLEK